MTQAHGARPRRVVNYKVIVDSLGTYIAFDTDEVLLPEGVLPHQLPENAQLERVHSRWHFRPRSLSTPMGAHTLRLLFLEFAEQMHWEAHLVP